MKTYAKKSNAVRAAVASTAKAMGIEQDVIKADKDAFFVIKQNDDGFYWEPVKAKKKPKKAASKKPAPKPVTKPKKAAPAPKQAELPLAAEPEHVPKPETKPAPQPELAPAPAPEPAPVAKPEPFVPKAPPFFNDFSSVAKPCELVWAIADRLPNARRRDVINACVGAGVAFHTAKTQYQKWYAKNKRNK